VPHSLTTAAANQDHQIPATNGSFADHPPIPIAELTEIHQTAPKPDGLPKSIAENNPPLLRSKNVRHVQRSLDVNPPMFDFIV
jgi:hypothetical protein